MQKVREGDELLRRARELNPDVRMPDMDELKEITKKKQADRKDRKRQ